MQKQKLAMACEAILGKAEVIVAGRSGREHESYLELCALLETADDDIALMFNNVRRSNAVIKLVAWREHGLVSDEELLQFSPAVQEHVHEIEGLGR